MSINYALSLADDVKTRLDCASAIPANIAITPEEATDGQTAKSKARAMLAFSINLVEQSLAVIRGRARRVRDSTEIRETTKMPIGASRGDAVAAGSNLEHAISVPGGPALGSVRHALSAEGLRHGTENLEEMATTIGPIIDKFDETLRLPYLSNYSGSLNNVPVVGVLGGDVMYLKKTANSHTAVGINYEWSIFSALPPGVKLHHDDTIHIFPYRGHFYLSIGRAVWMKRHINERDETALKAAVNNWPGMYVRDWTHVGNFVLPADDLANIVPFVVINANGEDLEFPVVVLTSNGTLSYLRDDHLANHGTYSTLEYRVSSGSPSSPPRFTKATYWSGRLVAVDDDSRTWNVTPHWETKTYTIADPSPIEVVNEFTADDSGIVALRRDGFLWRRIVVPPPSGSESDATLRWERWVRIGGVTHLGVASPGVILDMNLLARTLRSRYIDAQTSIYPAVNTIRAFGITHRFWLNNVLRDAEDWEHAEESERSTLAARTARSFVSHAQAWSSIVSRSLSDALHVVDAAAEQLRDVRADLEELLVILLDKLVGLQATLDSQMESLSEMKAAFWGTITAILLGLALIVVGLVFKKPMRVIEGGILYISGLVALIVHDPNVGVSKLAAMIADTEVQIRDVNIAIEHLSFIAQSFTGLDELYGTLCSFWEQLDSDASAIPDMSDATATHVGAEILADTSSIQADLHMTTRLTDACQTYLDVLNRQGIRIPDRLLDNTQIIHLNRGEQVDVLLAEARHAICSRDIVAYERAIKQAALAYSN